MTPTSLLRADSASTAVAGAPLGAVTPGAFALAAHCETGRAGSKMPVPARMQG